MPDIYAIARAHVHDLRTRRQDVLREYVRTQGLTDWVYTEESVGDAVQTAGLCTEGAYLAALRVVHRELETDGVIHPPHALRSEGLSVTGRQVLALIAETPGLDEDDLGRLGRLSSGEVRSACETLAAEGYVMGGYRVV